MGKVTVTPEEFSLVFFEADRIAAVTAEIAAKVGIEPDVQVEIEEASPLGRLRVRSVEPIELWAQGGALEDPRRPRYLSERHLAQSLGRLLFRVKDRLNPDFADAPQDDDLTLQQQNIWDIYCLGRLERAGYDAAKSRWLYHFRTRQGFSDVSDAAFDRLWAADGLTWADLESVRTELAEARSAA